ncbi:MAG: transglutaminase domain-containing protein [Lachnospiraceae bacterium]|nr:transglutaminase domain-containing protein [Lachnospiraceae bacterium]
MAKSKKTNKKKKTQNKNTQNNNINQKTSQNIKNEVKEEYKDNLESINDIADEIKKSDTAGKNVKSEGTDKSTKSETVDSIVKKYGEYKSILNIYVLAGAGVVLSLCVLIAMIFSIKTFSIVNRYIESQQNDKLDETKENDVIISDRYVIKDTSNISDAYKSGSDKGLSDRDKEIYSLAAEVIKSETNDKMTDYEKEKAIYDWMVKNIGGDKGMLTVIPTNSKESDNPLGTIKYKKAVCVGYATTFRLFMNMLGIDCMVVHNLDCYHSWDLVKIEGHWYHTDVYADTETKDYSHFNMSDSMRCVDQEWDTAFFPAADSLQYNMACQNIEEVNSPYEIPAILKKNIDSGVTSYCIRYNGKIDDETENIINVIMASLDDALSIADKVPYYINNRAWISDEENGGYLYWINLIKNADAAVDSLTDDQRKKLQKAFDEAFGDTLTVYINDNYEEDNGEDYIDDSNKEESYKEAG